MSRATSVRLEERQLRTLERIARQHGTSVGSLIRRAVDSVYLLHDAGETDETLSDYIRRHPQPAPEAVDELEERIAEAMVHAAVR